MVQNDKKTIIVYLLISLGIILLSRLYWIFGDDPIGLLAVFFFIAPLINSLFGLRLSSSNAWCWFPFFAGLASVLNYMCNSMMHFKLTPDSGTIMVFAIAFAGACAGVLIGKIISLLAKRIK